MYVCIVLRSDSPGDTRGGSLSPPGTNMIGCTSTCIGSMRGRALYDGVYMYTGILDDIQATRLYGKLISLQYDGIQNPDARRFQSRKYILYGHVATYLRKNVEDRFFRTLMENIFENMDPEVLAVAGPDPTAVGGRGLRSLGGCCQQKCHHDCNSTIKQSKCYLSILLSVDDTTNWMSCHLDRLINIPRKSMLVFRGDIDHAGGPYAIGCSNYRFFCNIVPRKIAVEMSKRAEYDTEVLPYCSCKHNKRL